MKQRKRPCKVCEHKKSGEITMKIRNGDSMNSLYKLYGISRGALNRHKNECMVQLLAQDKEAKEALTSDTLIKMVTDQIEFVQKMITACDKYLTDPDNPDEYFLGPQAHEIEVVYNLIDLEKGTILPQKEKADLQSLMVDVECKGALSIKGFTSKQADPRDLLLKAIGKLEGTAKMIQDSTQKMIQWEYQKKAMEKASNEGGSISFEKQVQSITEKVTVAMGKSNSDELLKLAGLTETK